MMITIKFAGKLAIEPYFQGLFLCGGGFALNYPHTPQRSLKSIKKHDGG